MPSDWWRDVAAWEKGQNILQRTSIALQEEQGRGAQRRLTLWSHPWQPCPLSRRHLFSGPLLHLCGHWPTQEMLLEREEARRSRDSTNSQLRGPFHPPTLNSRNTFQLLTLGESSPTSYTAWGGCCGVGLPSLIVASMMCWLTRPNAPARTLRRLRPLPTSLALRGSSFEEHAQKKDHSQEAGERAKEGTGLLTEARILKDLLARNNHLFSSSDSWAMDSKREASLSQPQSEDSLIHSWTEVVVVESYQPAPTTVHLSFPKSSSFTP